LSGLSDVDEADEEEHGEDVEEPVAAAEFSAEEVDGGVGDDSEAEAIRKPTPDWKGPPPNLSAKAREARGPAGEVGIRRTSRWPLEQLSKYQ